MTPEELLIKAAEDIATHGHWKQGYSDPMEPETTAPACAFGSLTRAATGYTTAYANLDVGSGLDEGVGIKGLIEQAALLLSTQVPNRLELFEPFNVITEYNDLESTTGEDMILAMKRAAHGG